MVEVKGKASRHYLSMGYLWERAVMVPRALPRFPRQSRHASGLLHVIAVLEFVRCGNVEK